MGGPGVRLRPPAPPLSPCPHWMVCTRDGCLGALSALRSRLTAWGGRQVPATSGLCEEPYPDISLAGGRPAASPEGRGVREDK